MAGQREQRARGQVLAVAKAICGLWESVAPVLSLRRISATSGHDGSRVQSPGIGK